MWHAFLCQAESKVDNQQLCGLFAPPAPHYDNRLVVAFFSKSSFTLLSLSTHAEKQQGSCQRYTSKEVSSMSTKGADASRGGARDDHYQKDDVSASKHIHHHRHRRQSSIRQSLRSASESLPRMSMQRLSLRVDVEEVLEAQNEESILQKSSFYVSGICCASEIPMISKALKRLPILVAFDVNTTTKTVYIEHPTDITTQDISHVLELEGFANQILRDSTQPSHILLSSFQLLAEKHPAISNSELKKVLDSLVESHRLENYTITTTTDNDVQLQVQHCPTNGGMTAVQLKTWLLEHKSVPVDIVSDGLDELLQKSNSAAEELKTPLFPRPTVILSGVFWIVSMLSLIGGNFEPLKYAALISVSFGLPPIVKKAYRTLLRYQFDTNCLMLFASIGAIALQDFTEAAAVVFLFALSEWLEVRATSRARKALSAIVDLKPDTAELVHSVTQEIIVVPASIVPIGAMVSVKTGDKIPCDGIVVKGSSTVDESSLTGELRPIRKMPDSTVSGGTVNSGRSPLTIRTTATAEDSAVSRLIKLVETAQAHRSETEKIVDVFASYYTPVIVVAAILMCSIPWAFGRDVGMKWTHNGLILIVVACPCALIVSTPVCYVSGLTAAAQKGVLIKGGAFLESLSSVKTICFDKTGTLTNGAFVLLEMDVLSNAITRSKVFEYLHVMEMRSSHPVAQAILAAAKNEGVTSSSLVLENHQVVNGEGVTAVVSGKKVCVGNERMFERLGLLEEDHLALVKCWKELGGTVGFMSIAGFGIVCAYCAADAVRHESRSVIQSLKKRNIGLTMLTGDNQGSADAIGKQVGLTPSEIKSKLLPEEKLDYIESLLDNQGDQASCLRSLFSSKRKVMCVGDGINDAPALAAADVGVAMGEGAAFAMETSDITLLDSNLEKIEYSIRLGRQVTSKIVQNVAFSLLTKFVVLGFALAGKTELWAAIATDVGSMLVVTLNAMTLLPKYKNHTEAMNPGGDIERNEVDTDRCCGCEEETLRNSQNHAYCNIGAKGMESKLCMHGCCIVSPQPVCAPNCCPNKESPKRIPRDTGSLYCLSASGVYAHLVALAAAEAPPEYKAEETKEDGSSVYASEKVEEEEHDFAIKRLSI